MQREQTKRLPKALPNEMIRPSEHPLAGLSSLSKVMRYHRGQEICGPGQPALDLYQVVSGAAGSCISRSEGRRQIIGLLLPGDFYGFSTHKDLDFGLEAVTEYTQLAVYPFQKVQRAAESDPRIAGALYQMAFEAKTRLEAQLLILGRTTAVEKVGSFLLEMVDRLADRLPEGHHDKVILPISRYDIADYLAISVETVSRSLTDLKKCGAISLKGTRSVRIVDRHALENSDGFGERPT
jgi:CRP-like cAMP-binding protein